MRTYDTVNARNYLTWAELKKTKLIKYTRQRKGATKVEKHET